MKKRGHKKAPFMSGIVVLLALFILPMYFSSTIAIPTMNTSTSPTYKSDFIIQNAEPSLQDRNEYYDSSKLDNLLAEWVESKEVPAGIMMNEKKVISSRLMFSTKLGSASRIKKFLKVFFLTRWAH